MNDSENCSSALQYRNGSGDWQGCRHSWDIELDGDDEPGAGAQSAPTWTLLMTKYLLVVFPAPPQARGGREGGLDDLAGGRQLPYVKDWFLGGCCKDVNQVLLRYEPSLGLPDITSVQYDGHFGCIGAHSHRWTSLGGYLPAM